MWIFLRTGFLSIVQHRNHPMSFVVRARRREHLEAHFAADLVQHTPMADYPYRVDMVPRDRVTSLVVGQLVDIDYDNFKSAAHRHQLKTGQDRAYVDGLHKVWAAMRSTSPQDEVPSADVRPAAHAPEKHPQRSNPRGKAKPAAATEGRPDPGVAGVDFAGESRRVLRARR